MPPTHYAKSGELGIAYQVVGDRPFDLVYVPGSPTSRRRGQSQPSPVFFDAPGRAVRCGMAIRDGVRALGLEIRAGVHTGECEIIAGKTGGTAAIIGARVREEAAPGEVLVTSTVRDLTSGSGIAFEDRGIRALKGVPRDLQLFAAS